MFLSTDLSWQGRWRFWFILLTFFQSRHSWLASYLSIVSWEEWAKFAVTVVFLVPCKPFALLYFCASSLAFLPRVCFVLCTSNTSRHKPCVCPFPFLWGFYPAFFVRSSVRPEESALYSTSQCSTCLLILHLFSTFNIVAKVVCLFIDHTTCGQTAYHSKGWGANAKLKKEEARTTCPIWV